MIMSICTTIRLKRQNRIKLIFFLFFSFFLSPFFSCYQYFFIFPFFEIRKALISYTFKTCQDQSIVITRVNIAKGSSMGVYHHFFETCFRDGSATTSSSSKSLQKGNIFRGSCSDVKNTFISQNYMIRIDTFCELYKTAIYGDEKVSLKTDLMRCHHDMGEDIASYTFRLRELLM